MLALRGGVREGDFDQLLAQRDRERRPGTQTGDPDPVDAAELDDAVGERSRDDDGEVGADCALILLQLVEPADLPVLGVLGLPDDRTAAPQRRVAHLVDKVGAASALCHRRDEVVREAARELGPHVELQHLALALLRALLALAPRLFERMAQIVDQLVLLLELEVLLLGETAAQRLLQALLLAVDPARHFEVELACAVLEHALFLAQPELGLLRDLALVVLLGELCFEELPFEGKILARLLFRLAGERREARLVLVSKLLLQRFAERDLGAAVRAGDHCRVHGRKFVSAAQTCCVRKLMGAIAIASGGIWRPYGRSRRWPFAVSGSSASTR